MTGDDMHAARATLAKMWGLDQPLTFHEMGRVLRLAGSRPDQSIRDYERGNTKISGPLSLAMEALLSGWRPADLSTILPGVTGKPAKPAPKAKATSPAEKVRKAVAEPQEAPQNHAERQVVQRGANARSRAIVAGLQLGPTPSEAGSRLKPEKGQKR